MAKNQRTLSFPDRKISETFLHFAEPLLDAHGPRATAAQMEQSLRLAYTIWNAVVYEDAAKEESGAIQSGLENYDGPIHFIHYFGRAIEFGGASLPIRRLSRRKVASVLGHSDQARQASQWRAQNSTIAQVHHLPRGTLRTQLKYWRDRSTQACRVIVEGGDG